MENRTFGKIAFYDEIQNVAKDRISSDIFRPDLLAVCATCIQFSKNKTKQNKNIQTKTLKTPLIL